MDVAAEVGAEVAVGIVVLEGTTELVLARALLTEELLGTAVPGPLKWRREELGLSPG